MAKQTFTTGQVLTAAQMTSLQQTAMGGGSATAKTTSYVLTAADAGTTVAMNAAGSTTITVNTGLFSAGDTVFIQNWGAGTCTITAGTATVTTHGSLALSQWEGGQLYFTSSSAAIFFDISQTSGMTNPMTTTGDTIYSSSGSTPARLGIGSTGQVLTVAGGVPSWATPASGGGMTLLSTTTLSGTTTNITGISQDYTNLLVIFRGLYVNTATSWEIKPNDNGTLNGCSGTYGNSPYVMDEIRGIWNLPTTSTPEVGGYLLINGYASTTYGKPFNFAYSTTNAPGNNAINFGGNIRTASAISSLKFYTYNGTSTFSGGQVLIYGVK